MIKLIHPSIQSTCISFMDFELGGLCIILYDIWKYLQNIRKVSSRYLQIISYDKIIDYLHKDHK